MKTSFAAIAFALSTSAIGIVSPTAAHAGGRGIIGQVAHCIASHAGGHRSSGPIHSGGPVYGGPMSSGPIYSGGPVYQGGSSYPGQYQPVPTQSYPSPSAPVYDPYMGGSNMPSQPVYSSNQVPSRSSQPIQSMPASGQVVQASGSSSNYGQPMPAPQPSATLNGAQPVNGQQPQSAQSGSQQFGQSVLSQPAGRAGQDQNSTQSALQMLASIGGQQDSGSSIQQNQDLSGQAAVESQSDAGFELPQFTAAPANNQPVQGGAFAVSLPGNQTIQLVLNNDSSFVWTATKDGKSSSFEGRYILENGRLTLVRSNDLQQMTGSWNQTERGAAFKLDGTSSSALEFNRLAN